ncbi:MAG: response regulator transcription factor [Micrococcaceae bacterium]
MEPIKVLIVDDQDLIRKGNKLVLESEAAIKVVGEASNGLQAISQCELELPDVVLMDVRMPVMDGITATEILTEKYPKLKIIILTTYDTDEYAFRGLQAGAHAFILKDTTPDYLLNAIHIVHKGDGILAPRVTKQLINLFVDKTDKLESKTPYYDERPERLTELSEREYSIFIDIASGLNNKEVAEKDFVSPLTVKTQVSKILAKLNLKNRVHLVILAYELGVV